MRFNKVVAGVGSIPEEGLGRNQVAGKQFPGHKQVAADKQVADKQSPGHKQVEEGQQ